MFIVITMIMWNTVKETVEIVYDLAEIVNQWL